MFACAQRGDSNEYPWLIVKVFGYIHDLERVRTHWIGHIKKCNNVSVKSGGRTVMRIHLCSSPMQRCKCNGHTHANKLFSTHHLHFICFTQWCVLFLIAFFIVEFLPFVAFVPDSWTSSFPIRLHSAKQNCKYDGKCARHDKYFSD